MTNKEVLDFEDFDELKIAAYKVALIWKGFEFKANWLDGYLNKYANGSLASIYKNVILSYKLYLAGETTEEDGKKALEKHEEKFNKLDGMLNNIFLFQDTMRKAFLERKMKFGSVSFVCPICGGEAYGSKIETPTNPAHKTTLRAGCQGCGFIVMN
ncbi:hypothetical protein [Cytobacillus gottheilii]|uniref:hypothetical protein n=1 Tax=Cytobacillus gottheilii TaxID=859144 RepID=UPI002493EDA7|nr:hypothetical protein [Cytobacillus gottheilii]